MRVRQGKKHCSYSRLESILGHNMLHDSHRVHFQSMGLHVSLLIESHVTHRTAIRLLPTVNPLMLIQSKIPLKGFPTEIACRASAMGWLAYPCVLGPWSSEIRTFVVEICILDTVHQLYDLVTSDHIPLTECTYFNLDSWHIIQFNFV